MATPPPAPDVNSSSPGPTASSGSRVVGATGGTVTIYAESSGTPRHAVYEAAVAPDGAFSFSLPIVPGGYYRAVYVDPATGVPYAYILRP